MITRVLYTYADISKGESVIGKQTIGHFNFSVVVLS